LIFLDKRKEKLSQWISHFLTTFFEALLYCLFIYGTWKLGGFLTWFIIQSTFLYFFIGLFIGRKLTHIRKVWGKLSIRDK
jgi:hypothetical protein